jgi:hypothetical protein
MSSGDSQERLGTRKRLKLAKVLEELRNDVRELGVRAAEDSDDPATCVRALDARSRGGCMC